MSCCFFYLFYHYLLSNYIHLYSYRTIYDLKTNQLLSHGPYPSMENTIVEHPHINPLYETRPVRYLFMSLGSIEGISSPPLGYMKLDIDSGEKQLWYAPLHTYCEELVVIPKKTMSSSRSSSSSDDNSSVSTATSFYDDDDIEEDDKADEDDVWLLASMYDAVEDRSVIGIFDGKNISQGPITRVWLKHHLPHSLHGCFTNDLFI